MTLFDVLGVNVGVRSPVDMLWKKWGGKLVTSLPIWTDVTLLKPEGKSLGYETAFQTSVVRLEHPLNDVALMLVMFS